MPIPLAGWCRWPDPRSEPFMHTRCALVSARSGSSCAHLGAAGSPQANTTPCVRQDDQPGQHEEEATPRPIPEQHAQNQPGSEHTTENQTGHMQAEEGEGAHFQVGFHRSGMALARLWAVAGILGRSRVVTGVIGDPEQRITQRFIGLLSRTETLGRQRRGVAVRVVLLRFFPVSALHLLGRSIPRDTQCSVVVQSLWW